MNQPRGHSAGWVFTGPQYYKASFLLVQNLPWSEFGMGSHFCRGSEHQVMHIRKALIASATCNPFYFSASLFLYWTSPFPNPEGTESGKKWSVWSWAATCPRPTSAQRLTLSCDCPDFPRTGLVWWRLIFVAESSVIQSWFLVLMKLFIFENVLHMHIYGDSGMD